MSDIEILWDKLRLHFNDNREWKQLNLQQQQVFIQGVNMLLAVLDKRV